MNKKNKNQILQMILKLNLLLGIYNIFLFCYGQSFFNLIIGAMNVGVWTFFRDRKLIINLIKTIRIKNN